MNRTRLALLLLCGALLLWTDRVTTTDTVLVSKGATWKYFDKGSLPAANWNTAAFADTAWASGPAQLGYGDGDEATVVGYGGNASEATSPPTSGAPSPSPTVALPVADAERAARRRCGDINGTEAPAATCRRARQAMARWPRRR
jgi:hypothetical protein